MLRNLDTRETAGISVSLDWESDTGKVLLTLDAETGGFQVYIPPANALDALAHPYYYFACSGDPDYVAAL